ncbi:MAG: C1 family peptidase [Candidatus Omnitrophota bacterium]
MTLKKSLLGLLFAAVLVSFIVMPSLQGIRDMSNDQIKFSPEDTMKDLQVKIQKMKEQIRREGGTYDVAINAAMQYPLDQLCGLKPELLKNDAPVVEEELQAVTPATIYTGYCSSIKNQGSCGSCWDFATCGAAEAAYYKTYGSWYDFSEQYVLDCNASGYSCAGGWFSFDTFTNGGVPLENCYYRYTATKYVCEPNYCTTKYTLSGSKKVNSSVSSIQNAIQTYGAVAVAVYADSYFQAYSSGCFSRNASGTVNHAVVLCGWDTTQCTTGAWKLKNSWGTSWGVSGYMWIMYGVQQVGYNATYCYK